MEAPKCELCGGRHWSGQPHRFPAKVVDGNLIVGEEASSEPSVVGEADKAAKYKDMVARRKYRREWMRRKREKGKP